MNLWKMNFKEDGQHNVSSSYTDECADPNPHERRYNMVRDHDDASLAHRDRREVST